MDAESLVQIERIVRAATGETEGRLQVEMKGLVASLREDTKALSATLREETQTFSASLGQDLSEKTDEAKRHAGVLYEDFSRKIDLVVEGHQALDQKIERLDTKMDHEFLETRAVIQLSYRQISSEWRPWSSEYR